MKWQDLKPDPRMVEALQTAEREISRVVALTGSRQQRHKWSNTFADACARMVAAEMRRLRIFPGLRVLPDETNCEPPTYVAGQKTKRVDVVVASQVSGLQVGISLKGMNFRDASGSQFDKNLTGRTYELQDEVRLVHEYQPASVLVALYFMPIAATVDKKGPKSASSFARAVEHLRLRTGRLDPSLPAHYPNVDLSFVALYVPGDNESGPGGVGYKDSFPRGVVRYFDVTEAPPKRGRPVMGSTIDLDAMLRRIATHYQAGGTAPMEWAKAENEDR